MHHIAILHLPHEPLSQKIQPEYLISLYFENTKNTKSQTNLDYQKTWEYQLITLLHEEFPYDTTDTNDPFFTKHKNNTFIVAIRHASIVIVACGYELLPLVDALQTIHNIIHLHAPKFLTAQVVKKLSKIIHGIETMVKYDNMDDAKKLHGRAKLKC